MSFAKTRSGYVVWCAECGRKVGRFDGPPWPNVCPRCKRARRGQLRDGGFGKFDAPADKTATRAARDQLERNTAAEAERRR